MSARATFTRMEDSTKEDWALIVPEVMKLAKSLPDRVLAHLALLDGDYGGFPVDRLQHSLQAATLALRDEAETLPISEFVPILRRLMAAPKNSVYKAALDPP